MGAVNDFFRWLFGDAKAREMGDPARNPLVGQNAAHAETWEQYRNRIRSERTPEQNRQIAREMRVRSGGVEALDRRIAPLAEQRATTREEASEIRAGRDRIHPLQPDRTFRPNRSAGYAPRYGTRGGYVGLRRDEGPDWPGIEIPDLPDEPKSAYGRSYSPPADCDSGARTHSSHSSYESGTSRSDCGSSDTGSSGGSSSSDSGSSSCGGGGD